MTTEAHAVPKVLVIDMAPLLFLGLCVVLAGDAEVIGNITGATVAQVPSQPRPDLLIITAPDRRPTGRVARLWRARHPDASVVLAGSPGPDFLAAARAAGLGTIDLDAGPAEWRATVRAHTQKVCANGPARAGGAAGGKAVPAELTTREREVLELAMRGQRCRAIAERLYISERTVEGHQTSLRRKLGVASLTQLACCVLAGAVALPLREPPPVERPATAAARQRPDAVTMLET
jgi:DNA-binding NarL/FixJ family response regulator